MNERRALRPMEYGEIFNEAFDLYKRNFLLLVGIGAVIYIPYGILSGLVLDSQLAQGLVTLGALLPLMAAYAALVKALADRYLGEPATIGDSWRYTFRRIVPFMLTWLLVSVLLGIVAGGVLALVALAFGSSGVAMVIAISLVVIVTMIVAGLSLAFLPSVMTVEDRFYMGAIRRSWRLAGGNLWRIFVVGFCTAIVTYGAFFVVFGLIGLFFGMQAVLGGGAPGSDPGMRGIMIGAQVISGVLQALLTPVTALPFVLLYFDVRVRREGYDIEILAKEMGASPELPPSAPA